MGGQWAISCLQIRKREVEKWTWSVSCCASIVCHIQGRRFCNPSCSRRAGAESKKAHLWTNCSHWRIEIRWWERAIPSLCAALNTNSLGRTGKSLVGFQTARKNMVKMGVHYRVSNTIRRAFIGGQIRKGKRIPHFVQMEQLHDIFL